MVTLQLMRSFREVAETLHFGRAAQRLNLAQPALSRQIQHLERELGARLFERTKRRVELTAEGGAYLLRVARILDEVAQAAIEVKRLSTGEAGTFSIAFINSTTYGLLPRVIRDFRRAHPNVTLELQEMTIIDQLKALANREVDVALIRPPVSNPDIQLQTITSERFLLVVSASHRLARRRAIELSDLVNEPLVQFQRDRSPLLNARVAAMCADAGFVPNVVQHVNQIHTLVGLVAGGLGVGLVPETARNIRMADVRFLEVGAASQSVDLAVGWHRDLHSALLSSFRTIASRAAQMRS